MSRSKYGGSVCKIGKVICDFASKGIPTNVVVCDVFHRNGHKKCDPKKVKKLIGKIISEVINDKECAVVILDSGEVIEINKNAVLLHDNRDHFQQSSRQTKNDNDNLYILRKHMRKL